MNRKELACATLGALFGAAGCSPAARSLLVPEASAEQPGIKPVGEDVTNLVLHLHHPSNESHIFLTDGDGFTVSSSNSAVLDATIDQGGGGAVVNLATRGQGGAVLKVHRSDTFVLQINAFVHKL